MKITDQEIAMLEAAKSEDEWNDACTVIKKARGNEYPPDWWARVKLSGLMDRVVSGFGGTTELEVKILDVEALKRGKIQELK